MEKSKTTNLLTEQLSKLENRISEIEDKHHKTDTAMQVFRAESNSVLDKTEQMQTRLYQLAESYGIVKVKLDSVLQADAKWTENRSQLKKEIEESIKADNKLISLNINNNKTKLEELDGKIKKYETRLLYTSLSVIAFLIGKLIEYIK